MIEASRKDVNRPLIRQPRGRNGSPRYSLNWESYSDLPIVSFREQFRFISAKKLGIYFQIEEFLRELAATYPNLVTYSVAGTSPNGNNMNLVKLSTGGSGKKAIFVDGGKLENNNKNSNFLFAYDIR